MAKGIRIKNADGTFSPAFILSQINDNSTGKATTYSSEKINELLFDKIDKTAVGSGLKFADGKLSLDIPTATSNTTYGGVE
jgi:hypothetical protein